MISNGYSEETFIYFIQAGKNGPVKIGKTLDLDSRLSGLQVGNHERLNLLCSCSENIVTEGELHAHLENYKIRGEWYTPSPCLLELVELLRPPLPEDDEEIAWRFRGKMHEQQLDMTRDRRFRTRDKQFRQNLRQKVFQCDLETLRQILRTSTGSRDLQNRLVQALDLSPDDFAHLRFLNESRTPRHDCD